MLRSAPRHAANNNVGYGWYNELHTTNRYFDVVTQIRVETLCDECVEIDGASEQFDVTLTTDGVVA